MKDPISKKTRELFPSGIRKFFDAVSNIENAISLSVGEPDFDTPWHIRDEGIYSLEKGRTHYTANAGLLQLRREIANYMKRRNDIEYDPVNEIVVTVGGSEAIDLVMRAMLDPGDEVIIPQPSFVSYAPCAVMAGGVVVPIEMKEEDEFRLTAEELEAAVTEKTKLLVLPFPNNPTGSIMSREDLEKIAKIAIEKDIYVVSDEIYAELVYGEQHVAIASLPGMFERTITLNGFSKTYAMTGWRLGYACGPKLIIENMLKLHQYAIMSAPTTSQYAAIEALKNGDGDIIKMREAYDDRRRFVMQRLKEIGLPCFTPRGAFYVFPRISEFGMSSEEFAGRLLNEKKLAVVPGSAFGDCGEGFIRISYAYSLADLKRAFDRMEQFVCELRSNKLPE